MCMATEHYFCNLRLTQISTIGFSEPVTSPPYNVSSTSHKWLGQLPDCAKSGKSAAQCGDEMVANVMGTMGTILDAVHESNPNIRVVGFGYDIM